MSTRGTQVCGRLIFKVYLNLVFSPKVVHPVSLFIAFFLIKSTIEFKRQYNFVLYLYYTFFTMRPTPPNFN